MNVLQRIERLLNTMPVLLEVTFFRRGVSERFHSCAYLRRQQKANWQLVVPASGETTMGGELSMPREIESRVAVKVLAPVDAFLVVDGEPRRAACVSMDSVRVVRLVVCRGAANARLLDDGAV